MNGGYYNSIDSVSRRICLSIPHPLPHNPDYHAFIEFHIYEINSEPETKEYDIKDVGTFKLVKSETLHGHGYDEIRRDLFAVNAIEADLRQQ